MSESVHVPRKREGEPSNRGWGKRQKTERTVWRARGKKWEERRKFKETIGAKRTKKKNISGLNPPGKTPKKYGLE